MATVKVVVGLGNPGDEYVSTRHNLGFMVVDQLVARYHRSWDRWMKVAMRAVLPNGVIVIKPMTYMNRSGEVVRRVVQDKQYDAAEILVVSDDFALPLGTMRMRSQGSAGGHNGLTSIINAMGSSAFPRMRLGMGPVPKNIPTHRFVLMPFSAAEMSVVSQVVDRSVDVIDVAFYDGVERAASKIQNVLVSNDDS